MRIRLDHRVIHVSDRERSDEHLRAHDVEVELGPTQRSLLEFISYGG